MACDGLIQWEGMNQWRTQQCRWSSYASCWVKAGRCKRLHGLLKHKTAKRLQWLPAFSPVWNAWQPGTATFLKPWHFTASYGSEGYRTVQWLKLAKLFFKKINCTRYPWKTNWNGAIDGFVVLLESIYSWNTCHRSWLAQWYIGLALTLSDPFLPFALSFAYCAALIVCTIFRWRMWQCFSRMNL